MPSGTVLLANVSATSVSTCIKLLKLLGKRHKPISCSVPLQCQKGHVLHVHLCAPCTAEPVSWGPSRAWDWVNLAKPLWGLNNWNYQREGFFLVTCNITEWLTDLCYMFDCICNVLFACYSDEFEGKAAEGTIIIQVFDFPMARLWNIQIPHDIWGHRNCQLKINFNGRKGRLLVKVQHLECILSSQGC